MNNEENIFLKAGVMGFPISHSLSPRLHNYWISKYKINGFYEALEVKAECLSEALSSLRELNFIGVNLTLPLKEEALALVDSVDSVAQRIGAINTIKIQADGSLYGMNSDAFGFIENLKESIPETLRSVYQTRPAVLLGAGGAARAICVALLDLGVPEIRILNRSPEKAHKLVDNVPGLSKKSSVYSWDDRSNILSESGLLINSTVLGMVGQKILDLDLEKLPVDAVVNDIVYAPLETDLLRRARKRGNNVVDGLGMLLHQGRLGFQEWFGVDPTVDDNLRQEVLSSL
tara:strand:- start:27388 stop:28251 length:864 start_codon:yes stop_codon:yes gene_type:complete